MTAREYDSAIVKRTGQCAAVAIFAAVALLALGSRRRAPANRMGRLPHVMLWAWERREDLSFIDSREVGVAYLAGTLYLKGEQVVMRPRRQPLIVPRDSAVMAVVRIESARAPAPTLSSRQRAEVVRAIARIGDSSPAAIQIDFDATRSQRAFYRGLLTDLRGRLPALMPLSITALASWCVYDDWIADLPVDEAVPMLFRMGLDSGGIDSYLRRGGDFAPALGRVSVGLSTDEPSRAIPAGRRIYIFSPHAWTRETAAKAIAEVVK